LFAPPPSSIARAFGIGVRCARVEGAIAGRVVGITGSRTKTGWARLPAGLRIYAVGDIHGRLDLLDSVLQRIDGEVAQSAPARVIELFVGDYVDRGLASRAVIDRLIARRRTHELVCLMGNHERYVLEFLDDPTVLESWRRLGGLETLMSYGVRPTVRPDADTQVRLSIEFARALPQEHRAFLSELQPCFACGDYFFAHAGVRPGVALEQQSEDDLLGIRAEFLACEDDFGKIIVHGHTPVMEPEVKANRINIDTGAYATGRLTCLVIEDDTIAFL
jgi:serine/threonine protein phosphatase 1